MLEQKKSQCISERQATNPNSYYQMSDTRQIRINPEIAGNELIKEKAKETTDSKE